MATRKGSKADTPTGSTEILELTRQRIHCHVLGTTPLIYNSMSAKAKRDLMLPPRDKNKAERQMTLKHDPLREYRHSVYRLVSGPTALCVPYTMFKAAICGAALDIPGAYKAVMGRLILVKGDSLYGANIPIYGIPQMLISMVRNQGMNRTPDPRTRAILPEWACEFDVDIPVPLVQSNTVVQLLAAAGMIRGIGDWRVEKGSGDHGQFRLVSAQDPDWLRVKQAGGRAAQEAALETPGFFDLETEGLYTWFCDEVKRRQLTGNGRASETEDEGTDETHA